MAGSPATALLLATTVWVNLYRTWYNWPRRKPSAAALANLDLIVTMDTALAYLAGAMGLPPGC